MIKLNLKDKNHFHLTGSTALNEEGFKRFTNKELESIKDVSSNVYRLARESSGIQAHFMTDSKIIKVSLTSDRVPNMTNITSIGQMGTDLYVYNEINNEYELCGIGKPVLNNCYYESILGEFEEKKLRKFVLNFPLYAETKEIYLEFTHDAKVIPLKEKKKRVMMYGTSILQGASASRPGLAYANILSRRLNIEILNYGFSGSGCNEVEIAKILRTKEADLFIIDTEANSFYGLLIDRLDNFLNTFKEKKPNMKIIIVNRIPFLSDYYKKEEIYDREKHEEFFLKLKERRKDIIYIDIYNQLADDLEITIDGIHPNDYGMIKLADIFEEIIKKYL